MLKPNGTHWHFASRISKVLLVPNRPAGWILMGLPIFTRYELAVFAGIFLLIWFFTGDNEQELKGIALFAVTLVLLSGIR